QVEADRVDARLVYGFLAGEFFRSTDAGRTFEKVAGAGLPTAGKVRFAAMPGRIGELWLAGGEAGGAYGMWRSTDAGASWTRLDGLDGADTVGFGKAAPGRSRPAIYTAAERDGVRGVYRSIDGGASWIRINDGAH